MNINSVQVLACTIHPGFAADHEGIVRCVQCGDRMRLNNGPRAGDDIVTEHSPQTEKRETVCLVRYTTGHEPTEQGTYAVRIDEHGMLQDKFLQWFNGQWFYPLSDQRFRAPVLGWVGPLSRTLTTSTIPRDDAGRFTTKE